jgi:signal transduction histidine kinase
VGLFGDSPRWAYDGAFRQESERLLNVRLKVASGIALISILLFALGDYVLSPSQFSELSNVRLAQCATIAVFALLLLILRDFDHLRTGGLIVLSTVIVCTAVVAVRTRDLSTLGEIMVGYEMATALLIPWGTSAQTLTAMVASGAYVGAMFVLNNWTPEAGRGLLGVSVAGAISIIAMHLLEESRRELFFHAARERELVSALSHDIRAPASAISMQAALLNEISQDEDVRASVHAIRASATQVLNLAQNMVDSIRIQNGQMRFKSEAFDLNHLMSETAAEQDSLARVKGVGLQLSLQSGLPELFLDPFQLKRVIVNLLNNAVKFTPEGGQVILSTSLTPDWFKLSIKDAGPGLGERERRQLFKRYTALARSTPSGVGLGLFISKSIVDFYKGKLEVESTPGQGSTFSVLLPRLGRSTEPEDTQPVLAVSRS